MLSPQPSIIQEIKAKTYKPKTEISVSCLFCYRFLKHCFKLTKHGGFILGVSLLLVLFFFLTFRKFFLSRSFRADDTSAGIPFYVFHLFFIEESMITEL